jgi:hypothetical protein
MTSGDRSGRPIDRRSPSQRSADRPGLTSWLSALVWLVAGVAVVTIAAGGLYAPDQPDTPLPARLLFTILVASLGLVGALVATRQPWNPIGWLLWIAGIGVSVTLGAEDYISAMLMTGLPWFAPWLSWLGGLAILPSIIAVIIVIPMLFPDGRLLSPRWRIALVFVGLLTIAYAIPTAFRPGPMDGIGGLQNPVGIAGARDIQWMYTLSNTVGFAIALALAIASLILRYRRGDATQRQQLKWFAAAAIATGVFFLLAALPLGGLSDIGWFGGIATIPLVPVAIGIAILRYRLYEIDRIISRTIAYGAVTITLTIVFVAVVIGLQAAFAPVTGNNTIAVAASTLVVAALFQPLRRRVQAVVDRRFNRARYDAERTAARFADSLRDEVDLDSLTAALQQTVDRAVRPTGTSVWLAERTVR